MTLSVQNAGSALGQRRFLARTRRKGNSFRGCVPIRTERCLVKCQSEPKLQRPKLSPTPPAQRPTPPEEPPTEEAEPEPQPEAETPVVTETETGPTIEFQRRQARAMSQYFESLKVRKIAQQPLFGWTPNNEIGNGRWVMFGLLVGLLTEYATGVNMVDQIKLMISNLGIADIYE